MYTIGEVSKIVNISSNTLRYYDDIGLLKPSFIQDDNQYRYYTDVQIKDITFILELKQYGCSLQEIKELLQDNNKRKLKLLLEEKCARLHKEIARLKDSSILLEKRIAEIIKEDDLKMKGGKILIVDDLALVRIMIRNIVEEYGDTVCGEAGNGEEAIIAYEELKPDLVIMDITMPIMDGIDAATKITEKYKNARIIICSAMSYTPIVLESIKAGARDFVSKPLSSLRLMNAVVRGFDDDCIFDGKKVDRISKVITNNLKEVVSSRALKQEEVDTLIYKIIKENVEDGFVYGFFDKINNECINQNEGLLSRPSTVEEKTITYLKEKFTEMSKKLSSYLSGCINKDCSMNLLTVENITMNEFKTLMNNGNSTGMIKYNVPDSSIYIHVYGGIKKDQKLLKEILNFTSENLNLSILNYTTIELLLSTDDCVSFQGDYSTILVSFSIEFDRGDKGFVAISIPHSFLQYLLEGSY